MAVVGALFQHCEGHFIHIMRRHRAEYDLTEESSDLIPKLYYRINHFYMSL